MQIIKFLTITILLSLLVSCSKEVAKESVINQKSLELQVIESYQEGIKSLKEGDVVPVQINEGVEVRVEDNAMFVAEMGEVAGQVAVNLTKRI